MTNSMNLYISREERKVLRKYLHNLSECLVINVQNIAAALGYSKVHFEDKICSYIINCEIEKRIRSANDSKRFKHIVYLTEDLRPEIVRNLKSFIRDNKLEFEEIVLIDTQNRMKGLHKLVDSVIPEA